LQHENLAKAGFGERKSTGGGIFSILGWEYANIHHF
jgi:hypothetical protein